MHKEIERKFLFDGGITALVNIMVNASGVDVEDYYFNEYTRYRWIGIKCWVGINVYKDIILALVEVELERADEEVILPYWCGKEVTNNKKYYNYNLWGEVNKKYGRASTISANSKDKFVNK